MTEQLALPTEDEPARLLSGPLTVESLRDAGYTATERALAELLDNSWEADAANVVVVIVQQRAKHSPRQRQASWRAIEMYVADDGAGMTLPELNQSLAFGAGTRTSRRGIGRFGMGLPQASVSQARRIDAWSWQQSYGMAYHTHVELDDIAKTNELSVPWPRPATRGWKPPAPASSYSPSLEDSGIGIPPFLKDDGLLDEIFNGPGSEHGTVIGWSKMDRTSWTTAKSVANHIAFFLGRTYRRYLAASDPEPRFETEFGHPYEKLVNSVDLENVLDVDKAKALLRPVDGTTTGSRRLFVRVVTREEEADGKVSHRRVTDFTAPGLDPNTGEVLPNDPEYLLPAAETNLGSWLDADGKQRTEAPFTLHRRPQVIFVQSRKRGDDNYYPVFISTTYPKQEARPADRTGATEFGQHAKRNQGLSVVRADRELLLLDALSEDTQRRFVGIQVDFHPQLDEVFGVTNNKQEATLLSAAIKTAKDNDNQPLEDLINSGRIAEGSNVADIYPVARAINQRHTAVFKIVKDQKASGGGTPARPTNAAHEVKHATEVDKTADSEDLTVGEQRAIDASAAADYQPPTAEDIVTDLIEAVRGGEETEQVYDDEAVRTIASMLAQGSGYAFLVEFNEDSSAFFRTEERIGVPEARGSSKLIWLNMSHPIWQNYLDSLRIDDEALDHLGEAQLRDIIRRARGVIVNMLIAWSRIELGGEPTQIQAATLTRERWGTQAKRYLTSGDDLGLPSVPDFLDEMFG